MDIIKRLKAIETMAQLLADEATAARKELEGGGASSNSPVKGKKEAEVKTRVLSKRRTHINNKNKDHD